MSGPETGSCSIKEYDRSKRFIVTPGRLCVEGAYTFIAKARIRQKWEAYRWPVQAKEVAPPEDNDKIYRITLGFERNDKPNVFYTTRTYPFDDEGFIRWTSGPVEEAYIKHRFDARDDEIEDIMIGVALDQELTEIPELVPALASYIDV